MTDEHDPTNQPRITQLSPADAQRLDARLDPEAADAPPPDAQARDRQLDKVLALLDQCPSETGDASLVDRTLKRIQAEADRHRLTEQVQMLSATGTGGGGGRFNMGQVMTIAGMVLIAVSLLLPVLARNQHIARRLACQNNLADAAGAFQQYAGDHSGTLPRGKVKPGSRWWNVGQPGDEDGTIHSNSAHLYLLIRQQYAEPETLACPANPHAHPERMTRDHHDWPNARAVSYSYQNQYTKEPIDVGRNPGMAVLADKNPLFIVRTGQVTQDRDRPAVSPSRMHKERGQNVLTSNGRVTWRLRPVIGEREQSTDNIWVVRGIERYQGNETPRQPGDSFLVP